MGVTFPANQKLVYVTLTYNSLKLFIAKFCVFYFIAYASFAEKISNVKLKLSLKGVKPFLVIPDYILYCIVI